MIQRLLGAAVLALLAVAPAAAADETWRVDPVHSTAAFTITHLGISHVTGVIPIKDAQLIVPANGNIPSRASAAFDPSQIDTRNSMRDGDLRSNNFFDAATYPQMTFTSTKIDATDATHFTMAGNLTMHGQTHPVTLTGQYLGRGPGMKPGETRIAFTATGSVDRTQWGMTADQPIVGTVATLQIDVEAVKQ